MMIRATLLIAASVFFLSCRTPGVGSDSTTLDNEGEAGYNCIQNEPMRADGYDGFAIVSEDQVHRKVWRDGRVMEDPEKIVWPQDHQIQAAMRNIGGFVNWMERSYPPGSPDRRVETYRPGGGHQQPYCLFHPQGRAVFGTVILFHGFNDRPDQQAKLGSYLFHSGFNVYNVFLAQHFKVPGTKFWPKTVYKPELLAVLQQKMSQPQNVERLAAIGARMREGGATPEDVAAIDTILGPELSMASLQTAWTDPGGEAFQRYFNFKTVGDLQAQPSDFLDFLRSAEDRLRDLEPMPGPIFVSGLSVGATVAMALAVADGGRRIRGVVAQTPWIASVDNDSNLNITFAGPLDEHVGLLGGQYPIAWSHGVPFSPASIAASYALGAWVKRGERLDRSRKIPHAFFTTRIDNSANNGLAWEIFDYMNKAEFEGMHYYHQYPGNYNIGHAITDPENYESDSRPASEGGDWNRHWRTLYQEIYRFFTRGNVVHEQFLSRTQDTSIPDVKCRIRGRFAYRCDL